MASNALSSRRSYLRRPKVCREADNPGRCHPPPVLPPRWCELDPSSFEELPDQPVNIVPHACCEALPEGQDVSVAVEWTGGTLTDVTTIGNCADPGPWEYTGTEGPGSYYIEATFTWSDTGVCIARCEITITEEG